MLRGYSGGGLVPTLEERYAGCLIGAAVGDALGTGKAGASTQQLLFVAEGLLRAHNRLASRQEVDPVATVHRSLLRWLETQRHPGPPPRADGWLSSEPRLYSRRRSSTVTTHALRTGLMGRVRQPINNSREAGPLPTVTPVALVSRWDAFRLARDVAAITHGHPSVGVAAGAFAHMLQQLVLGADLADAVEATWAELEGVEEGKGLLAAMDAALDAGDLGDPDAEALQPFGEGRNADSALAIALYCASVTDSFSVGMDVAIRHEGGIAWPAALAGALLGARGGLRAIPEDVREKLELGDLVATVAGHLHQHFARSDFEPTEEDWNRYPG